MVQNKRSQVLFRPDDKAEVHKPWNYKLVEGIAIGTNYALFLPYFKSCLSPRLQLESITIGLALICSFQYNNFNRAVFNSGIGFYPVAHEMYLFPYEGQIQQTNAAW